MSNLLDRVDEYTNLDGFSDADAFGSVSICNPEVVEGSSKHQFARVVGDVDKSLAPPAEAAKLTDVDVAREIKLSE